MIIKAMALIEVTIDFADEEVPTDVSKDVKYILIQYNQRLRERIEKYKCSRTNKNWFRGRYSRETKCW